MPRIIPVHRGWSPEQYEHGTKELSGKLVASENSMKRLGVASCCLLLTLMLAAVSLLAQQPSASASGSATASDGISRTVNDKLDQLDQKVAAAQSSADNAWMLVSAALVLMMTGPGLALFYGGLVRQKNVLAIMMQSFALMALITVLWALVGYSLCFGGSGPVIGNFQHAFLRGIGVDPNPDYAATIPQLTFMIYQLMFAVITPALITGATAERMKFSGTVLFMTLWFFFVYAPMAHMVWGKGGFLNAALGGRFPTLDFAGGTVVHITSGVSALVCALYLGKRVGFPKQPMPPHSLVLSFIGACLLWVGWFGFNAGSAVNAGPLASSAFIVTHFATAAAVLGWMIVEWIVVGKPSVLGAISGAVAGLVAITPASGFVKPMPAILIGLAAGVVCYLMVSKVKKMFGYDDALDAFGVHVIGGTLGAILTGVFATKEVNDLRMGKAMGMVDGDAGQIVNQLIAVLIAWVLAIVGTLVILKICDVVFGVRVNKQDEMEGLDLSMHGEEGYNLES